MNRRLELVIEKDRLELVMNHRLEYALPYVLPNCLSLIEIFRKIEFLTENAI